MTVTGRRFEDIRNKRSDYNHDYSPNPLIINRGDDVADEIGIYEKYDDPNSCMPSGIHF